MTYHVYIIHGWSDSPQGGWFPWLKKQLEPQGIDVHIPAMPDSDHPQIDTWVPFLKRAVRQPDRRTILVGHSIGCQAILRYLELLPAGTVVGGVVMVAGWVTLKAEAMEDDEATAVAAPWLARPFDWPKIRSRAKQFTAIMSDDDPYVPIEDKETFRRELGASIIIERQKRHMSSEDGIVVLPSVKRAVLSMTTTE